MLRHVEIGGNFADGPKRFRRFCAAPSMAIHSALVVHACGFQPVDLRFEHMRGAEHQYAPRRDRTSSPVLGLRPTRSDFWRT